jgi:hypothetical protein
VTRILIALSFVTIVLTLPKPYAGIVALAWGGCALLAAVSYILARARSVGPAPEVVKHPGGGISGYCPSRVIGLWITHHVY